jgi:hypothetical protein
MKKLLLYVFLLMICLAAGCKKDNQNKKKVYLLSQEIVDDRADGAPIDTTNYSYDDQNHLTLITTGAASNRIRYTMSYNAAGLVDIARKVNSDGSIDKEYRFFYTPSIGYVINIQSKKPDTASITFNSNNQVTQIKTLRSGYSTFAYDARGNISILTNYNTDGSNDVYDDKYYTYDTEKNYFSGIAPNNYFLMFVLFPDASTLINNAITINADVYSYTYNADGFPVKAMAKITNHSITPIYYNYILK